MRNLVFHTNKGTPYKYTQISLRKAEKLYNAGERVFLVPSNLNPLSQMVGFTGMSMDDYKSDDPNELEFRTRVYWFVWYNCVSSETGKYPIYFQRTER